MKPLNEMSAAEAVELYESLDLHDQANKIIENNRGIDLRTVMPPWNKEPEAWEHTSFAYGFIAEETGNLKELPITDARSIKADDTLCNSQITVSLDFLNVFDYPGKGKHKVMIEFNALNHISGQEQELSFNQVFSIQEGQRAPISGYPIFIGLNTGGELVQFNTRIVNISNNTDEKLLEALEGGMVSKGITLVNSLNPVIPVITQYAKAISEAILKRNQNVEITSPSMGLYFGDSAMRMKLARGSYITVQVSDPEEFTWKDWIYDRTNGRIRSVNDKRKNLPYNYFAFSISASREA